MTSPYQINNVKLNSAQLLRAVNGLIKYRSNVTWPTLARWRNHWHQPKPPYSWEDAQTYAHYGDLLALGFSAEDAKQYTIEHFEQQESTHDQSSNSERQSSTATIIDTTAKTA